MNQYQQLYVPRTVLAFDRIIENLSFAENDELDEAFERTKKFWAGLRGASAGSSSGKGLIGKISGAYHGAKAASQAKGAQLDREAQVNQRAKEMAKSRAVRAGQDVVRKDILNKKQSQRDMAVARLRPVPKDAGDMNQQFDKWKSGERTGAGTKHTSSLSGFRASAKDARRAMRQQGNEPKSSISEPQKLAPQAVPPAIKGDRTRSAVQKLKSIRAGGSQVPPNGPSGAPRKRIVPPPPPGHPESPIVGAAGKSIQPTQRSLSYAVPTPKARMMARSMQQAAKKQPASMQARLKKQKPGSIYARAAGG